jgi:hypothetical protein
VTLEDGAEIHGSVKADEIQRGEDTQITEKPNPGNGEGPN